MDKVNISALIGQVRRRPILWDMNRNDYNYKTGKREAWLEVCHAICEDFEENSEFEKKAIVQNAKEKWRTLRDNFMRSKRKGTQVTTQKGMKNKKYAHWEQLNFLIANSESHKRESVVDSPLRKRSHSDLDCTEESDFENEAENGEVEIKTDHSYIGLSVKNPECEYEKIDTGEMIEIPVISEVHSLIHQEKTEEINIEKLIDEVRQRPLLWDMMVDEYKARAGKTEAWMEVCNAICEGFEEKSSAEKIVIVQDVKLKWRSLRDNFIRNKKKGQSGRKHKKYMYWDRLQFLVPNFENKLTEPVTTVRISRVSKSSPSDLNDLNCTKVNDSNSKNDSHLSQTMYNKSTKGKKMNFSDGKNVVLNNKVNKVDFLTQSKKQLDENYVAKNELQKKSEHEPVTTLREDEQFFNSLLSSVAELSDLQKLQFRIEVMQALIRAKQS